ncbi:MAG: LysM peptidoglycan-binding domain-containing protein [Ilumatobacteraceae bacterium]
MSGVQVDDRRVDDAVPRAQTITAALAALAAAVAVLVGVPVLLITLVGNPWPGRARLELGDEVGIVVGLLAVAGWVLWARFVVAVASELRLQLGELRRSAFETRRNGLRVELVAPAASRQGVGLVAQRLVAAVLLALPIAARAAPTMAEAPLVMSAKVAAVELTHEPAPEAASRPAATSTVTVRPGDTLFGLARSHLGGPERWREIFELNRDRLQADGHRLASPSGLRAGWRVELPTPVTPDAPSPHLRAPAAPPAPYAAATTLMVQPGDTLWDLTETRLEATAGAPADDSAVAAHLELVIDLNADVVEDPNVIYVGQELDFPAIGEPPPEPAAEALDVPPEPVVDVAPTAAELVSATVAAATATAPAALDTVAPVPTAVPNASPVPEPAPTSTAPRPMPPEVRGNGDQPAETESSPSPSPIGIGEAALLSAGVLALVAARRRQRLRAARPRARIPEPPPGTVATERRLRSIDAGERLLRVDVAVRAAAAELADGEARVAIACAGTDGTVELVLTADADLPSPWRGDGARWQLPGGTPLDSLAGAARSVGAPCVALAQLGVDAQGRDVVADLEGLGLLSVAADPPIADSVVRGIAATLAASVFAEVANLIGVGLDDDVFLDHRQAHHVASVDEALELATTLVGTTRSATQSTFTLRARHTSGEAWEPAVVLTAAGAADEVTPEVVEAAARRRSGLAMVVSADPPGAPWCLRRCRDDGRWVLQPLALELTPVGLTRGELEDLHDVLACADVPLDRDPLDELAELVALDEVGAFEEPRWTLLVRMLGPVEVVDADAAPVRFERSKSGELVVWLTLHRERSTRAGARTALWDLDVRDATFANVVSESRRAMARHVEPPTGEEWLGRTLTEVLPLHPHVVADVDLVRLRVEHARRQPVALAIETLRPAVELIRDLPFAGTGFLWPDAEGITSNLVLLATGAAAELAGHYLTVGDVAGVFWATGQGLKVLPGHEELIALRMRAHATAGDLSGVRQEWECYERVLHADPWSDGEPAPKLLMLRRELLST